jgi:hypothetical protein
LKQPQSLSTAQEPVAAAMAARNASRCASHGSAGCAAAGAGEGDSGDGGCAAWTVALASGGSAAAGSRAGLSRVEQPMASSTSTLTAVARKATGTGLAQVTG